MTRCQPACSPLGLITVADGQIAGRSQAKGKMSPLKASRQREQRKTSCPFKAHATTGFSLSHSPKGSQAPQISVLMSSPMRRGEYGAFKAQRKNHKAGYLISQCQTQGGPACKLSPAPWLTETVGHTRVGKPIYRALPPPCASQT